jgi:hypothetical protein
LHAPRGRVQIFVGFRNRAGILLEGTSGFFVVPIPQRFTKRTRFRPRLWNRALLCDVREFVCEQRPAERQVRSISTRRKVNVRIFGETVRTDAPGTCRITVDSYS